MTGRIPLSDAARRILDQEERHLTEVLGRERRRAVSAAETLESVCSLMNVRGRYSGVTAEHFDRQDYEGIRIIDALDERLARSIRDVLKGFVDGYKRTPDLKALQLVAEKLSTAIRDLPPYPVAYMILGAVHAAIASFSKIVEGGAKHDPATLEHSLVHTLLGIVDKYVQTRERPLQRHHSDIQREYVVVRRMKCGCGEEKYEVTLQALCHDADGMPYDRLELQCRACGARRTITFDLPYFKDLEKM